MAITYHMAPIAVWHAQRDGTHYVPEAFEDDGFIHCTDSLTELVAVGNRYYTADPRPMICLEIDLEKVSAEVRYEDPQQMFPHIYGPLETGAVIAERDVHRTDDGQFVSVS